MEAGPVEAESEAYARHPSGLWLVGLGVREWEEQRGFGDMNQAAGGTESTDTPVGGIAL